MATGSHRKQYLIIFLLLGVLTAIEVGVAYVPAAKALIVAVLVGLAVTKAAIVALYYMHLKTERKVLRRVVAIPLMIPPFYAVILMAEAVARRIL